MAPRPLAIDYELVAFSFAAENWMVIENQAIELGPPYFLKNRAAERPLTHRR